MNKKSLAKSLGELFAYIQDLFDTLSYILIRKVDQNNKQKNKLLSFFSSIGNSYYKKYSNIKKQSEYDDDK